MSKGPAGGHPNSSAATRWRMRSHNGSEWVTQCKYYPCEVANWECAKPLWPVFE